MIHNRFKDCINACLVCAVACNQCATACLGEDDVNKQTKCIQLDLECAAICRAAVEIMSLGSDRSKELCSICAGICDACAKSVKNTLKWEWTIAVNAQRHAVLARISASKWLRYNLIPGSPVFF